ncbi:MAG: 2,4'-dihydroxyacetophenone dioxygenase family protein [Candidatus Competibacteraceae bacterium]|nr:2,4'-dihydroxyacetophenone dioxygenase family protein [Candidatus Competibacteraceae bacterium]
MSPVTRKEKIPEEYVQMDQVDWKPFPDAFSAGGIRWKLLHVSPEMGAWTAIFDCPAGSSFAAHIHVGPGEYFLTKGKMDVRGGKDAGGDTAVAPGYGYESANARHDKTYFPVDSEFYMTFLGPLTFITPEGAPIAVIGWEEAQGAWLA